MFESAYSELFNEFEIKLWHMFVIDLSEKPF